jgi:hypothetical protein
MQQKYVPPEVKLAGEAAEVVLGGGGGGSDMFGEFLDGEGEFAADTDVERE